MIFKAQVGLESNFTVYAISPDQPCRIPAGWTVDEAKSFGLMQLTPACRWLLGARLANGHPNMETDPNADLWATSVFNPTINVGDGVHAITVDRASVMSNFPGCSEEDYTKMALATFNRGSAVTGCNQMTAGAATYVSNVMANYASLARSANWPNRYAP
jgi:soluble lytic murein transglycosylase-like protein